MSLTLLLGASIGLLGAAITLHAITRKPAAPGAWIGAICGLGVGAGLAAAPSITSLDDPHAGLAARDLSLWLGLVAAIAWIALGLRRFGARPSQPLPVTVRWACVLGGAALAAVGLAGRVTLLDGGALLLASAAGLWLLAPTPSPADDSARPGAIALGLTLVGASGLLLGWANASLPTVLPLAAVIGLASLWMLATAATSSDRDPEADLVTVVAIGLPLTIGVASMAANMAVAWANGHQALRSGLPRLVGITESLAAAPALTGLEWLAWLGVATIIVAAIDSSAPGAPRRLTGAALIILGAACAAPWARWLTLALLTPV